MFGTLKTVEDHNLYSSFGLVDGLSDDELMDINGGMSFACNLEISCDLGGNHGDNNTNSKIGLNLSFEKNFAFDAYDCWHGESYGIFPDYWSLGKDLNDTIFLVTEDEMMKEKLSDIGNRLM